MNPRKKINQIRLRRLNRARAKIVGSNTRPRLAVFRSNTSFYAQLIDDVGGRTLVSASTRELLPADREKPKGEQGRLVGELLAKKAIGAQVRQAVFDRRRYRYHGRVRAFADAVRKGGLVI